MSAFLEVILHCNSAVGSADFVRCPLLGGCLSTTTMVISIRNTDGVRSTEVVRFSEGPLSEVPLYTYDNREFMVGGLPCAKKLMPKNVPASLFRLNARIGK